MLLSADRREQIVRAVDQLRTARVADLAQRFAVTEETIRRDLAELHDQGRLRRIHGGAISLRHLTYEPPVAEREQRNLAGKVAIAERAAALVEPEEILLFDASTTALQVAKYLPNVTLTVVTNSLRLANELAGRREMRIVLLGGMLRERSLSCVGPQAERMLANYRADRAFLSCRGVDLDGATETNELEASLKQQMIAASGQAVLLADAEKIGVNGFCRFADPEDIDLLITNADADADMLSQLEETGLHIELAK